MSERLTIGFIGLGNMGTPMSRRLLDAGIGVRGFDLDAAARERFAQHGGTAFDDLSEMVPGCAQLILMLPNSDIVGAVLEGDGGVLERIDPGTLIVDMSSSEPLRTRALAERVAARGGRLIDAPVSGGVGGANAGTLSIMVGGNAADVASAEPVLAHLGRVSHVGAAGAGHALKAINNLMSATHLWVTSEAMQTGIAFGLAPETMLEVVNRSSGRSGSTEHKWPKFILGESYDSGFSLALMLKDMRIATGLAEHLGVPHALSDAAVRHWQIADADLGRGADHTEVARWLAQHTEGPEGR
ncbi:NAD(P)-dependent oxidoreductase [Leucobacter triazinivorans]|uniref:NAD(P)-dependent oxidoreductase n=1 Tax=Leucobacter triazinivorans TaxID=1784719 RepID=A0A4P6KGD9_9MICO|nr:NAD(P)-dependent oxidoreductase [Leucobacter triazinivorans]QBE49058.1 NAD(P)-dependent oxidoreductase [Leucobacter triazinivorans]